MCFGTLETYKETIKLPTKLITFLQDYIFVKIRKEIKNTESSNWI